MPTPPGRHWTAKISAVATSGWTKRTIAAEAEAVVVVVVAAEVVAAEAEVAVALAGDATATSDFDLRRCAGDPDPVNGLGPAGQPGTRRATM